MRASDIVLKEKRRSKTFCQLTVMESKYINYIIMVIINNDTAANHIVFDKNS